jgi:predicted glycoside hydrolase/deacetylase ChbG (UPF0249 family)
MSGAPRHIWLCADDYGMSPGVSRAIRDLIDKRRINATSAMVVADALDDAEADALRKLRDAGKAAVGLHLTLTAPFKPLSSNFKPLRDGAFLPLGTLLRNATMRTLDKASVVRETAAQIDAFTAKFGFAPDYVDGHQHVQLFPQIRDAVLDTVARLTPDAWMRQCGRNTVLPKRLADHKGLLLDILSAGFRRAAARRGVRLNPAFAGTYDFNRNADVTKLFPAFFRDLPAGSLVMCHPGIVDDTLRALDPLTTLREHEYAYLGGDDFPRVLEKAGVTLR